MLCSEGEVGRVVGGTDGIPESVKIQQGNKYAGAKNDWLPNTRESLTWNI